MQLLSIALYYNHFVFITLSHLSRPPRSQQNPTNNKLVEGIRKLEKKILSAAVYSTSAPESHRKKSNRLMSIFVSSFDLRNGDIWPILCLTFIIHCAVENMQKKQFNEKQMQQCNSTAIGNDCNCLLLKIEVIYNTTNCLVLQGGGTCRDRSANFRTPERPQGASCKPICN